MTEWIDQGDDPATILQPEGNAVTVLFASDPTTLEELRSAAG